MSERHGICQSCYHSFGELHTCKCKAEVVGVTKTANLGPSDVVGPLSRFTNLKPCFAGMTQMLHGTPPRNERPSHIAQTEHITLNLNYPHYEPPPAHYELTAGHELPYPWQDLKTMHDALWAKQPVRYK